MLGSKFLPVLALILGGCMAEAGDVDTTDPTEQAAAGEEIGQTQADLVSELPQGLPAETAQEATSNTGAPVVNPGAVAVTGGSGKPQPDPWRDRANAAIGPNKPQPDPWRAALEATQAQATK